MNRTIILAVVFLLLGGITIWYLSSKPEDRSTVAGWDREFAVEADQVYKVFLLDRNGNQTTLERKKDHWVYNGRWRARPNAIENLLDAVSRVQMKYKPPRAAVANMVKSLASEGIKVELYDRAGNKIKTYYVGGATPDERGTYMIMENSDEPYVVHIPSWEGNLRFRYNLAGNDWRDKSVFVIDINEIQSVAVEYPKQKNKSFQVEKEGKDYKVEPYKALIPKINRPARKGAVETFLYGFESLVAEAFENDNPRRDSIKRLTPFSVVTLKTTDGEEQNVRFYPIFERIGVGGQTVFSDRAERYFAALDNGDFMLVQHRVFKDIFWAYDFFFEN